MRVIARGGLPGTRDPAAGPGPDGAGPPSVRVTRSQQSERGDGTLPMYQVLGPVECFRGRRAVALGGVRQRRVLAALLMDADHVVSTTRLIEATWQQPPPTAQSQIQMVISRLRRALVVGPDEHVISTEPSGYRLQAGPGQLDSAVFQEHVAAAQDLARSSLDEAVARLRDGLAMWRGSALAGLEGSTVLDSWAGSLEETRLAAHELCLRLELQRGRHTETVGELMEATEAHPLREGLQGLLMQALYLSERQAEALAVYRQTRRRLIEELGVEPAPGCAGSSTRSSPATPGTGFR